MGPLETLAVTDINAQFMVGQPQGYLGAFGAEADSELALRRETVRARFPPSTHYRTHARNVGSLPASQDSPNGQTTRLRLIGSTRDMPRYPGETDVQYCERLSKAFPSHIKRGTPSAIIEQLRAFGFVDVHVFEEYEGGFYAEPTDEYGWRFVVVIGPNFGSVGWSGAIVGQAVVGVDTTGLGTGTIQQMLAIKKLIVQWKQAFAIPLRFVIVFGNAPIVGLAIVGGSIVGGGQTTEVQMVDVRTVGAAVVGQAPLWGFNF